MKQTKKIIISIMMGIIALFGFYTTSNAYTYNVGQSLGISIGDYYGNSNIYCLEERTKTR